MVRAAVLASGDGSRLQAILDAVYFNEIPNFEKLTSKQRIKKLSSYLTSYVESQRSANTYAAREKKNPKWKKDRELAEYLELLTSTRIRMGIHCLNDEELNMYVDNLDEKLADAIAEMDVNKKFKREFFNHWMLSTKNFHADAKFAKPT